MLKYLNRKRKASISVWPPPSPDFQAETGSDSGSVASHSDDPPHLPHHLEDDPASSPWPDDAPPHDQGGEALGQEAEEEGQQVRLPRDPSGARAAAANQWLQDLDSSRGLAPPPSPHGGRTTTASSIAGASASTASESASASVSPSHWSTHAHQARSHAAPPSDEAAPEESLGDGTAEDASTVGVDEEGEAALHAGRPTQAEAEAEDTSVVASSAAATGSPSQWSGAAASPTAVHPATAAAAAGLLPLPAGPPPPAPVRLSDIRSMTPSRGGSMAVSDARRISSVGGASSVGGVISQWYASASAAAAESVGSQARGGGLEGAFLQGGDAGAPHRGLGEGSMSDRDTLPSTDVYDDGESEERRSDVLGSSVAGEAGGGSTECLLGEGQEEEEEEEGQEPEGGMEDDGATEYSGSRWVRGGFWCVLACWCGCGVHATLCVLCSVCVCACVCVYGGG